MVAYDASIIVTFAEKLYEQADRVVLTYTIGGALIGASLGLAIGIRLQNAGLIASVGAVFVGAMAFIVGQQKAFALRLQAQTALCQVQIESNTRM